MATIHQIGPFRLDAETGIVFRNAEPLALGQRAVALLRVLVERAGAPVSKAALMDAAWSGLAVEESNLTAQIAALRRVFREEPGGERWIETLPRRGYRFVGPVVATRNPPQEEGTEVKPALLIPDGPSLAVLPFVNMSGDPEQEYFSDGITEDIITDLSKVSTLNVLSRNTTFTFKGKAVEIGQLAQRLKVGYVVEGSVRKAGGRVRITAQLIDASKDSHVWGERYDRELKDIFALQDEIAQAIVAALKIRLLPAEKKAIESRSTQDPEAYQLYLQGRYYRTQQGARNLEIAVRFCRRALEIDPDYARAWALVALCQAGLHFRGRSEEPGLSAAEKALALDPTLAEAYTAKGRALAEMGRFDEALAAQEESLRLEPDSFEVRVNVGVTCLYLGRYEDAIEHSERAAQLFEADYWAPCIAADCYRSWAGMTNSALLHVGFWSASKGRLRCTPTTHVPWR